MDKKRRKRVSSAPQNVFPSRNFVLFALLIGFITILSLISLIQLGDQASITGAAVLNSGSVAVTALTAGEIQFMGVGSMLAVLILAGVLLHVVKERHHKPQGNR